MIATQKPASPAAAAAQLRSPLQVLKHHLTFAELDAEHSARHWAVVRRQILDMEAILAEYERLDQAVQKTSRQLRIA